MIVSMIKRNYYIRRDILQSNDAVIQFKIDLEISKTYANNIYQKLEDLQKIDTTNIEPLVRVGKLISILREDEIDSSIQLDKKSALTNAKERNEDFIIIQRNKK